MSTASSTALGTSTITAASASSSSSTADSDATVALTTTFTPPSPCTSHYLTMLANYHIWLNEPLPVPGSTFTSCYPSAWIADYSSVEGSSSSIVPLVTPMVCPSGWSTASSVSQGSLSGYFACCPSGFDLALPTSTAVSTRPFYGGTCYSDFTAGDTISVTKYDSTSLSVTIPFTPQSTDQAFGHPIDGFVRGAVIPTATTLSGASSSSAAASAAGTAASAQSSGASSSSSSSSDSALSGGAIAGVVVGAVAGVALLALAAWALLRRRRKASSSAAAAAAADASEKDATSPGAAGSHAATSNEIYGNEVSELGGEAGQVHEIGADSKGVDGSWYGGPRAEMEGRGVHDVPELDGESPGGGKR